MLPSATDVGRRLWPLGGEARARTDGTRRNSRLCQRAAGALQGAIGPRLKAPLAAGAPPTECRGGKQLSSY